MAADYAKRTFPASPKSLLRKMLNRGGSKGANSFGGIDINDNNIRQKHLSHLMPTLPVCGSSAAPSVGPSCSP
jgi:hypothetical protein